MDFDVSDAYPMDDVDPCEPTDFSFPNCCCRCLAGSPAKLWKIKSEQSKMLVGGSMTTTHEVQAPVCSACFSRLMTIRWTLLSATGLLALVTAAGLWFVRPASLDTDPKTLLMVCSLTAIFLFPVFCGVYFLLGAIVAPRRIRGVADLTKTGDKITFYNPDYQRLYLELAAGPPENDSRGW